MESIGQTCEGNCHTMHAHHHIARRNGGIADIAFHGNRPDKGHVKSLRQAVERLRNALRLVAKNCACVAGAAAAIAAAEAAIEAAAPYLALAALG